MNEPKAKQYEGEETGELSTDPRTRWAAARTRLAEERTFNAWLRSGLGIMAFSLAIARFVIFDPSWISDLIAILFFFIGAMMIILGYLTYHQSVPVFDTGDNSTIPRWIAGTLVVLLILLIALLLVIVLISY